eukprot:1151348-Pelagomonas_calceolata.AAC.1
MGSHVHSMLDLTQPNNIYAARRWLLPLAGAPAEKVLGTRKQHRTLMKGEGQPQRTATWCTAAGAAAAAAVAALSITARGCCCSSCAVHHQAVGP